MVVPFSCEKEPVFVLKGHCRVLQTCHDDKGGRTGCEQKLS